MHSLPADGSMIATGGPVVIPMSGVLEPPNGGLFPLMPSTSFPLSGWDPLLRAQVVLGEFGSTDWRTKITLDPPPDTKPGNLQKEVDKLMAYAKSTAPGGRADRLPEIIAQAQDFTPYWADMLKADRASRPATWTMVAIGVAVGQLVAMHFKHQFQRARPAQVYPAIMPPILTPAHPSYPNAHALQSYLIAACMTLACPALAAPLSALAERIGENREIAGVHWPSDRDASKFLAPRVMSYLNPKKRTNPKKGTNLTKRTVFQAVLDEAKLEWQGIK